MKKQQKIIIAILAAIVVLSVSFGVWAAGTSSDPIELITKDYIDNYLIKYIDAADKANAEKTEGYEKRIKDLEEALESSELDAMALESGIGELEKTIESLSKTVEELKAAQGESDLGSSFETVHLTKGQKLMATGEITESCEIILRSGQAKVVSSYVDMGLSDASNGANLLDGNEITLNHLVIIPRGSDGRGIKCASTEIWVLVRGEYTIE